MSAETTPPSQTEANGRTAEGKFTTGNKFAKGNPFAKRRAEFRSHVLNKITNDDLSTVLDSLLSQAKDGDLNAIKLMLEYTIGKPDFDLKENEIHLKERQYDMWFESEFWQMIRKNGMVHPEYSQLKKFQEQIAIECYRQHLRGEEPDMEKIVNAVKGAILMDLEFQNAEH